MVGEIGVASRNLVDAAKRLEDGMNDDFNTRVALVEVWPWLNGYEFSLQSGGPEEGISGLWVGFLSSLEMSSDCCQLMSKSWQ